MTVLLHRVTPRAVNGRAALGGSMVLALPAALLVAGAPQVLAQDALPAQCSPDGEQVVCEYTEPGRTTWTVPGRGHRGHLRGLRRRGR